MNKKKKTLAQEITQAHKEWTQKKFFGEAKPQSRVKKANKNIKVGEQRKEIRAKRKKERDWISKI